MQKRINAVQLNNMIESKEKFMLINVLDEADFSQAHIAQSINIPLKAIDFVNQASLLIPDKSQKIVVYCASKESDASSKAAKRLEDAGYNHVYDFKGGIEEWREQGNALEHTHKGLTFVPNFKVHSPFSELIR